MCTTTNNQQAKLYICAYDLNTDKSGAAEVIADSPILKWDYQELVRVNSTLPQGFNMFFINSVNEPSHDLMTKISKSWDKRIVNQN